MSGPDQKHQRSQKNRREKASSGAGAKPGKKRTSGVRSEQTVLPPSTQSDAFLTLKSGAPEFLQPFSRDILLMRTFAAGCHHVRRIKKYLTELETGQRLTLLREPKNPYDERAILIMDGRRKLGYIPRAKNEVLANLMDAGKYLYAVVDDRLTDFSGKEFYYRALTISVYMQD